MSIVVAVIATVLVVAGAAATFALNSLLAHHKQQLLSQVGARLGREVRVGRLSATVFTGVGVTATDVVIGGDPRVPEDRAPLISAERVRIKVGLGRAIASFGRRITVKQVIFTAPTVSLVRFADGELNVERVARRWSESAPPSTGAPMSERDRRRIENARIAEARIDGGRVRFVDLAGGGAPVEISQIDLALNDVGVRSRPSVRLSAALPGAPTKVGGAEGAVSGQRKNLEVRAQLGAAGSLEHMPPPLESVRLKLDRTDLAPLAPLVERVVAGLEAGTASADLDAHLGALAPGGRGPTQLKGQASLRGARFRGGEPFDAALTADLDGDRQRGDLNVRSLRVQVAAMSLSGHGRLRALASRPRFEGFAVESQGVDFDELRRLYPRLDQALGATLHGEAQLRAQASGDASAQRFTASLDLTPASIAVPARIDKPAGVPLRLEANGSVQGDGLALERVTAQLADLALTGGGTVRRFAAPVLDLRADAELPELGGLLRLLPAVAAELPSRATVAGKLAIHATASGPLARLRAHAELGLSGANLALKTTRLVGDARAVAELRRDGLNGNARIDANLDGLEVAYPAVVHKPRATPCSLHLVAERVGHLVRPTADLALGPLKAHAEGTLLGEKRPVVDVRVTVDGLSVPALTAMLPALAQESWPPIAASAKARLSGTVGKPESMSAEVSALKLTSRNSDLDGSVVVHDLARPHIELKAQSRYLDTADLLPGASSTAPPPSRAKQPAGSPGLLARASGHASVTVARGVASGVAFDGLQAQLALDRGRVRADKLEVGAFSGRVSGNGSELDLGDEHGPFHLVGRVSGVDLEQLTKRFGGPGGTVRGRLSADVDARGRGTARAEIERTLSGTVAGSIEQTQLLAFNLGDAIAGQLVGALPLHLPMQRIERGAELGTVRLDAQLADGALVLRRPLAAATPEGALELSGRIFFDGRLDLTGTLRLDPTVASAMVANQVKLTSPLPLSLTLRGELRHPSLGIGNLSDVARALSSSVLRAGAGGLMQGIPGFGRRPAGRQRETPGQPSAPSPPDSATQQLEDQAAKQLKGLLRR